MEIIGYICQQEYMKICRLLSIFRMDHNSITNSLQHFTIISPHYKKKTNNNNIASFPSNEAIN